MARKPKVAGAQKRKKPKMTLAEQSERFIKAARELRVDETGREFENAFRAISAHKPARTK